MESAIFLEADELGHGRDWVSLKRGPPFLPRALAASRGRSVDRAGIESRPPMWQETAGKAADLALQRVRTVGRPTTAK